MRTHSLPPIKRFTPSEANRALPLVRRIVDDVVAAFEVARSLELRRAKMLNSESGSTAEIDHDLVDAARTLRRLVGELELIGCQLKDAARGLVDFPGTDGDREVSLCWRRGETSIEYWHDVDAGFAGRQPLSELRPPSTD